MNKIQTIPRGVRYPVEVLQQAERLAKSYDMSVNRILTEATAAGLPLLAKLGRRDQAGNGEARERQKETHHG